MLRTLPQSTQGPPSENQSWSTKGFVEKECWLLSYNYINISVHVSTVKQRQRGEIYRRCAVPKIKDNLQVKKTNYKTKRAVEQLVSFYSCFSIFVKLRQLCHVCGRGPSSRVRSDSSPFRHVNTRSEADVFRCSATQFVIDFPVLLR